MPKSIGDLLSRLARLEGRSAAQSSTGGIPRGSTTDELKRMLAAELTAEPDLIGELAESLDVRAICTLRIFARSIGLAEFLPAPSPEVVAELRNTYGIVEPSEAAQ